MSVTVYIDLSAKLGQWTRDSAIAMANDQHSHTLLISSSIKQRIRRLIKLLHGSKSVQYRLLAVLVYMVVRESLDFVDYIVIDKDYGGPQVEATVKNLLLVLIRRDNPNANVSMI